MSGTPPAHHAHAKAPMDPLSRWLVGVVITVVIAAGAWAFSMERRLSSVEGTIKARDEAVFDRLRAIEEAARETSRKVDRVIERLPVRGGRIQGDQ